MTLEVKYIHLCSSRLRNFQQKSNTNYNFSCPLCGDSHKSSRRARGYFLEERGKWYYYCHNCPIGISFSKFLLDFAPDLYEQYRFERFKDNKTWNTFMETETKMAPPKFVNYNSIFNVLKKVSELSDKDVAKKFLIDRKIPAKYFWKLYFCPNFMHWTNSIVPGKFKDLKYDEARVVIPFVDGNKKVIGFQGRAIKPGGPKYITISLNKQEHILFGRDTVDIKEPIYVTEGPFDSMFLPNSVAVASANLPIAASLLPKNKLILVFDNEPRNKNVAYSLKRAVKEDFKTVIFPSTFRYKDINDAIVGGMSEKEMMDLINTHTFKGLRGLCAFKEWERV